MNSNDLFSVVDNDLDYMKVDPLKIMEVPWSSALSWAQETLICRDIFSQVRFFLFFLFLLISRSFFL